MVRHFFFCAWFLLQLAPGSLRTLENIFQVQRRKTNVRLICCEQLYSQHHEQCSCHTLACAVVPSRAAPMALLTCCYPLSIFSSPLPRDMLFRSHPFVVSFLVSQADKVGMDPHQLLRSSSYKGHTHYLAPDSIHNSGRFLPLTFLSDQEEVPKCSGRGALQVDEPIFSRVSSSVEVEHIDTPDCGHSYPHLCASQPSHGASL